MPSRGRAIRRRWVAILSVVTVVAIAYVVLFSSLLSVRTVEVNGAHNVPADAVRAAAGVQTGRPMVQLDTDEIEKKTSELAGLATVEVSRSWPSTIEITVTERTAIAFYAGADGLHLVDKDGVDLKTVPEHPDGMPKLELQNVAKDDASTRSALGVLSGLPEELRSRVTTISAVTPGNVQLHLDEGQLVRWGDATQNDRKAKVLAALLSQDGGTYDVSSPELPTVS